MPRIDPRVHPLATFDIPLLGGESFQLGFESLQYGLWQAVRQMKGHMLRRLGTFKVWQISTAVPHRPGNSGSAILLPGNANLPIGVSLPANREIGVPGIVLRVAH